MKKIILCLIVFILSVGNVEASMLNISGVKKIFEKPTQKKVLPQAPAVDDGEMTLSEMATAYYSSNDLKNAFDTLIKIKESDRTAQDWLLIGNILQDQNKTSDAIFMYKRATVVDAKYYKAYYNLGNIYLDDDKPFLAIENYRLANKSNNKFPYAYYNLGCAYLRAGKLNNAKIAFLKAIELKNTVPEFHYNLAYTYKMLKKDKLAEQYLGFYNKLMEAGK